MTSSSDSLDSLLKSGVDAAKRGDKEWARFYLEWVLGAGAEDAHRAEAWFWLSRIADDPAKRRECLQKALVIDPFHGEARRALDELDGKAPLHTGEAETIEEPAADTPQPVTATPSEAMPASSPEEESSQEEGPRRTKCPMCGATLIVYQGEAMPRCQFCGYDESGVGIESTLREQRWAAALYSRETPRWALPTGYLRECASCNSTFLLGPSQDDSTCPICGAPNPRQVESAEGQQQPEGALPFILGAAEAVAAARRWMGAQGMVGRDLASASEPRPVFLPFWTFAMGGDVRWRGLQRAGRGKRGKMSKLELAALAADVILSEGNSVPVADEQGWVHDSGAVPIHLSDLLIPAVESLPDNVLDALRYDSKQAIPYSPEILTQAPIALQSVSIAEGALRARMRAMNAASNLIYEKTRRRAAELQVEWNDLVVLTHGLLLFPAWVVSYSLRGEPRVLAVNAQNGQVTGDVPPPASALRRLFGR